VWRSVLPGDVFGSLGRSRTVRLVTLLSAVGLVASAGCFGSSHASQPSTAVDPSKPFAFAGDADRCPRPPTYVPKLSPARGSAGTLVTIRGTLPLFGENGKLDLASPTTKMAGWWNLRIGQWVHRAGDVAESRCGADRACRSGVCRPRAEVHPLHVPTVVQGAEGRSREVPA
jgi:hypothetical protein